MAGSEPYRIEEAEHVFVRDECGVHEHDAVVDIESRVIRLRSTMTDAESRAVGRKVRKILEVGYEQDRLKAFSRFGLRPWQ